MDSSLRRVFRQFIGCCVAGALAAVAAVASSAPRPLIEGMTHHRWGMEDGLPDQLILAVAQTPDGYLWLGTPHGLVRFDGLKFAERGADAVPALHEFGVSSLLVSKDGSLWVGSVGGGVTHISSNAIVNYGESSGLSVPRIRALFEGEDGIIWAGTDAGLYRRQGERFVLEKEANSSSINAISSDGCGGMWMAGSQLRHFTHGEFHPVRLPARSGNISSMAVSSDGTLWMGDVDGLMMVPKGGQVRVLPDLNVNVRSLRVDREGHLWIGTIGNGLLMRDRQGRVRAAFELDVLGARAIRSITTTANGDLWAGSQIGLFRISATGMDLVRIPSAAGSDVGSLLVDRDNSVWLAAGKLSRWDGRSIQIMHLPGLANMPVRSVNRQQGGALWVAIYGHGVYRVVRGHVTQIEGDPGLKSATAFLEAPHGVIWIGSNVGLLKWHQGVVSSLLDAPGAPHAAVRAMAVTRDGDVWLGTPAGLFCFHKGAFVETRPGRELAHLRVWSLFAAADGSLWIGAENGLYLWHDKRLHHVIVPARSSQVQNVVSVLIDTKGRILVADSANVYRLDGAEVGRALAAASNGSNPNMDEVHLHTPPEIFAVARETGAELYGDLPTVAHADALGGVWYASYQGLVHIRADMVVRHDPPPPISVDGVWVDGVRMDARSLIRLPASAHTLVISVTPILLSARTGMVLERHMEGFETGWSAFVPGSDVIYGKLPPGRYTFSVRAQWPGEPDVTLAQIQIVQDSVFYRKPQFLIACCAGLLLVAFVWHRGKLRQMLSRLEAVADERHRMACEIHDTLLQGNIGTAALLEAIECGYRQDDAAQHSGSEQRRHVLLRYIHGQVIETIKEAREAIWNLESGKDRVPLQEALRDVLVRATAAVELQTSYEQCGNPVPMPAKQRHGLIMATREAVINAVTHAHPTRIEIRVRYHQDQIEIDVQDDGCGFNPEAGRTAEPGHFGLTSMRDRLGRLGGKVKIESSEGLGTTVHLSLPLLDEVAQDSDSS